MQDDARKGFLVKYQPCSTQSQLLPQKFVLTKAASDSCEDMLFNADPVFIIMENLFCVFFLAELVIRQKTFCVHQVTLLKLCVFGGGLMECDLGPL